MGTGVTTLTIDFETRSTCDLKKAGAWQYSQHPTTDIWCACFCVDDGEVKTWRSGDPVPIEIITAAADPSHVVVAHNAGFERSIWVNILGPRYGWPAVGLDRFRCTMAMAQAMALPAALGNAAEALGLDHKKDDRGRLLMLRMARPRKPRKGEDPRAVRWHDDPKLIERLIAYCVKDVQAERALYKRLPPLIDAEQAIWQLNMEINERGIPIDRALLVGAIKAAQKTEERIQTEFHEITDLSPYQTEKLLLWLKTAGAEVTDLRAETLEKALAGELAPLARRAIELRLAHAQASAKKLIAFAAHCDADDRARGSFQYHGAHTGRFTSHGIQTQNMKKAQSEDLGAVITAVMEGRDLPLNVLGDLPRAIIAAAPGRQFFAADYSGIESVTIAWLAGEQAKLDMWRKFFATKDPADDPYFLIGKMMGVPDKDARAIGKVADLAFGYAGGVNAWRKFAPDDPRSDAEIKDLQKRWKGAHPRIVQFWHGLERAAINAVKHRDALFSVGKHLAFRMAADDIFLKLSLPTGRALSYPFARISRNDRDEDVVIYKVPKGPLMVDCRGGIGTYGGHLAENVTQAVARDVLTHGMMQLDAAGFPICLHVHDEVVAEVENGFSSVEEFVSIMTAVPAWAEGLPLSAKGRNGPRFAKIAPPISDEKPIEAEPPPWEEAPPIAPDDQPKSDSGHDHGHDRADLPAALVPLSKLDRWCIWRWVERNGKRQKPPFQARDPDKHASTTDPTTWADYATALAAVRAGHGEGLTFVITPDDPYAVLDFDHCRDPRTGVIDEWAQQFLRDGQHTYAETSVSGAGAHIWGTVTHKREKNSKYPVPGEDPSKALEVFVAKAVTISGNPINGDRAIENIDRVIAHAIAWGERERARRQERHKEEKAVCSSGEKYGVEYYDQIIEHGAPEGTDPSAEFHRCVGHLIGCGWSVEEIFERFDQHPDGIGKRYRSEGRLLGGIERSAAKFRKVESEPPPWVEGPPQTPGASPNGVASEVEVVNPEPEGDPPSSTDTAALFDAIYKFLGRFVIYPSEHAQVAHVLWIAHTHLMDCWDSTPRLAFLSAEPKSGKTRALEITALLVPRPVSSVNVTSAYIFRKISDPAGRPTILYDEIDTIFGAKRKEGSEEIRGVLNAGYQPGATVGRCTTGNGPVGTEDLPAYAAVALGGLGWLPDTILSRSIVIRMRRRKLGERVEPFRRRRHEKEGCALRKKLAAWATSIAGTMVLTDTWPEMPAGVEDRDADSWESLLAIADKISWRDRAHAAAIALVPAAGDAESSMGIRLLEDLRTVFGTADKLHTGMILSKLHALEESPWNDLGNGRQLNDRGLASRLRQYGVRSKDIRIGEINKKGYEREALQDTWDIYLPLLPAQK